MGRRREGRLKNWRRKGYTCLWRHYCILRLKLDPDFIHNKLGFFKVHLFDILIINVTNSMFFFYFICLKMRTKKLLEKCSA